MCTAVSYKTKDHYFGRNLDLEYSYHETVTVTPRNKKLAFRHVEDVLHHPAMIGMAYVVDDDPLYYEATNESGLSIAGLNFPGNAQYNKPVEGKDNIASFELIPWILSTCRCVADAREKLARINITDDSYSDALPASPLHWMIADASGCLVFEQTKNGGCMYDNPVGVMTNNPPFDYQLTHLMDYMGCSPDSIKNKAMPKIPMTPYSRGMGGIGIPGDLSSASRFVKAAFTKMNSISGDDESASVSQFFKILGSVEQQKGCCRLGERADGTPICEYTIYSSCCNTDKGIYYYTTYENSQITAVDMQKENLDGDHVIAYELVKDQQVSFVIHAK